MQQMTHAEWQAFLRTGIRTAKLATVRRDGRPHVAPVWFVLDGDDVLLTTSGSSLKGKAIRRDDRVCLCVDDPADRFSFVMVDGVAEVSTDPADLRRWATVIAERYVGAERAEAFGARNGVAGELLVRVRVTHVVAYRDVAG